jgi:hypothetical protein
VVEGVTFQFLNKGLPKQFTPKKQNIVTSDELQEQGKIYSNAEELLNEILKNKQYKHSQHIQYLADRRDSKVMKIRFVLNPYSFLFLLSGEQNYFVILETLHTEVPDEGYGRIVKLHDKLYSDKLKDNLRLDLDFIPLIGIGNSQDRHKCKKMVDEWNKEEFELRGTISRLKIVRYENDVVTTIEEIKLK